MGLNRSGRLLLKGHGFSWLDAQCALFLLLPCQCSRCVALKWNETNVVSLVIECYRVIEMIHALLFRFSSGEFDLWHRRRLLVLLVALEELEQVAFR